MTRSNWSKKSRTNKGRDLQRSQKITVMTRYGSKSIGRYATTYMNRDRAAVPQAEPGILEHDINAEIQESDVAKEDVSRETSNENHERRLFDDKQLAMSKRILQKKLIAFEKAQKAGHTPIIQVVSFADDYLREMNVSKNNMTQKPSGQTLDDAKLRLSMQSAIAKMAKRAGFKKLEYLAAIHGNTAHPHVHIAMIETDDSATGRLAAREPSDQFDEEGVTERLLGKTKAAKDFDKAHGVSDTVERGMMRQSELDYFRQEIDSSLQNMSRLVNVRDLEKQQTYALVVNQDVMREARHNKHFIKGFVETYQDLQKGFEGREDATKALDIRVEKLARELLSGSDFGQKDFMRAQIRLGQRLGEERALEYGLMIHAHDEPTAAIKADYETMDLDAKDYNGLVLAPSEFADSHQDASAKVLEYYVESYQQFIKEPNLKNLDGLVLADAKDLDSSRFVKEFVEKQDQLLVGTTKNSIYELLSDAKDRGLDGQKTAKALNQSLKVVHGSPNGDSFKSRLHAVGVRPDVLDDELLKSIAKASDNRKINSMPKEIQVARDFLKDNYQDALKDLDAMSQITNKKKLSKEDRMRLYENSRDLRRQVLGAGDLTKSGSMLHAALSEEVAGTGSLKRVHKLKVGESNELFLAYEQNTAEKVAAAKAMREDLDRGVSFSEPKDQSDMRRSLSRVLKNLAEGYESRLDYVQEIKTISKMPDAEEKEALAQLKLNEALRRQGIDEGKSFKEIQKEIDSSSKWSAEDKLATAMTLHLKESKADIDEQRKLAIELAHELQEKQKTFTDKRNFDASKTLQEELRHQNLVGLQDVIDQRKDAFVEKQDLIYNPSKYQVIVNGEQLAKRDEKVHELDEKTILSLNRLIDPNAEVKTDFVTLQKERLDSQKIAFDDLTVNDAIQRYYDTDVEKGLYNKEQELANISDDELQRDLDDWRNYQRNFRRKATRKKQAQEELAETVSQNVKQVQSDARQSARGNKKRNSEELGR